MELSAHGISCSLDSNWDGTIFRHNDGSEDLFAPTLHASTGSMPSTPQGTYAAKVSDTLAGAEVLVAVTEFYPDDVIEPGADKFAPSGLPTALTVDDFSEFGVLQADNPESPDLVGTQKFCTVNGRAFSVYVVLGSPDPALVADVNQMLSTVAITPAADAYRASVLRLPAVGAYWRLGELSGTAAADEMGTSPGTYTGPYTRGRPGLIVDSSNTAVQFAGNPGSGGAVVVNATSKLLANSSFTLSAWFKLASMAPSPANKHTLVSTGGYFLAITNAGEVEVLLTPAGAASYITFKSPPGLIVANQTYHVAVVLGGPAFGTHGVPLWIYLDGDPVAVATCPVPLKAGGNLTIGGYFNNLVGFTNGTIDEVAFHQAALPLTTIQDQFRIGSGRAPKLDQYLEAIRETPDAVAHWRLHEVVGLPCRDSVGTAHGTKSGSWVSASTLVNGTVDRATTFNTGTMSVAAGIQLPTAFSVEMWLGPYQLPSSGTAAVISCGRFKVEVTNTGALKFSVNYGSNGWQSVTSPAGTVAINQIYHLVCTFGASTLRIYKNAVQAATTTLGLMQPVTWPAPGVISFGASTIRFALDEVVLYGTALEFPDVVEHHRIGTGAKLDAPPPPPPPPPAPQPPAPPADPGPADPPYFPGTGVELSPDDA